MHTKIYRFYNHRLFCTHTAFFRAFEAQQVSLTHPMRRYQTLRMFAL